MDVQTKNISKTEGMNQREIAEALGLSRAAIQKIEERAIQKFRAALLRKNIKITDLF